VTAGTPSPERIRASVVCVHEGELLCVRLRDPKTGIAQLFPPGGAIKPGESAGAAAERETLEETGYRVALASGHAYVARYPYTWNGTSRSVTTHFFRARLLDDKHGAAAVHDASYHEGVVWLPLAELDRALGFEPAILAAVRALVVL
jgi:8-oxo-dGTP pyrophosphatase MutT (NUDIX family)